VLATSGVLTSTVVSLPNSSAVQQGPLSVSTSFNATTLSVENATGLSLGTGVAPTATLDVQGTLRYRDTLQSATDILTSDLNGVAHWLPMPKGFIVATANFVTPPLPASTDVLIAAPTVLGPSTPEFSMPSAGVLQYNGTGVRISNVTCTMSLSSSVNFDLVFTMLHNGSGLVPNSSRNRSISGLLNNVALTVNFALSPGDTVSMAVSDFTGGAVVDFEFFQLVIQ
jgi:hypothetical protein